MAGLPAVSEAVSPASAHRLELVSGNRMVARGALEAGCRFFSGYPITPSSEIYATMMAELPARDGGAMIGLGHLVNAALLNPEVTVPVHNNFLFGMTGGQNSAFTPKNFITSTTPAGNATPPLDLAQLLLASQASFVARKLASNRDLAEVIARAITHPRFVVVELLDLCTAYATRWNPLTGAQLKELADRAGYELGVLREQARPIFAESFRERETRRTTPKP